MDQGVLSSLADRFPFVKAMPVDDFRRFTRVLEFPVLARGQTAYELGDACPNYLMCITGRTRVFKTSDAGREMLLYNVEGGGTCVLTTQCLLSRTNFPAESVAESLTVLAAVPARCFYELMESMPAFREFVIADYTRLLSAMFSFVDALAFQTIEQRLAHRLLAEADAALIVRKTHQQLASEIGSVREIVSRHLGNWGCRGWIETTRGEIRILDRAALASRRPDPA
ncbi:Crp/Fnr family transcriptional regulator [Acidisphaera rubrifaciens]|uniref:HTH crp-type domain-containing protein n=1 Tax=Acidisphaera rubrifaciens HS-AP3 TaxID=1231350 RepID=A0A0D6PA33_9PROT|nr:Crp/Fnr family transcriptional regulator [Acidisphaera rubrifaciens]GAN78206.1 hypothetical protein Asru_0685_03 [Acidisphaera rubrifaciens HS-AP3]